MANYQRHFEIDAKLHTIIKHLTGILRDCYYDNLFFAPAKAHIVSDFLTIGDR
ncbi:MAG: hypothetical protein WBM86_02725 [Waterburya sp.]